MKVKIKKIIITFFTFIFMGFTILISISIITSRLNNEVPSILNHSVFMIVSSSMEPELSKGDIILINRIDPKNVKENDVITFVMETGNVKIVNTHRVIKVNDDDTFTTRGDNAPSYIQETVFYKDYIGRYTGFKIPKVGLFIDFLFSNLNILFGLIILIAIIIIGFEIKNIINHYKENRTKNEN